jgi:two-component system phosphate regulon sensor histidine kinase PhoR
MRRIQPDRKTWAVIILIVALGGLGIVQYLMISQYYVLSRTKLDQQIWLTLTETQEENYDRTVISNLLSSVIRKDTTLYRVSRDSLQSAGPVIYRMYLTNKLTRENIPTDFEFAVRDHITMANYLESDNFSASEDWVNRYTLPLAGVIAQDCSCAPYLDIRFPSLRTPVIQGMKKMIVPALACFALLIIGFILLLRILREQKYLDHVKNDFINNLTHELKTPVFSISLAAKLLKEKGASDEYISRIESDVEHLKGNVDKVLELASLEDSKSLLHRDRVAVGDFIRQWRSSAVYPDSRLEWDVDLSDDIEVNADREHLQNALNNLVDNALKYDMDENPVRITVRNDRNSVVFGIHDQGPGIDKPEQEAIFAKFYRVKNGHARARGYGLGLSYTRQVIEMMKGKVSVESSPGKGSTFEIKLPVA